MPNRRSIHPAQRLSRHSSTHRMAHQGQRAHAGGSHRESLPSFPPTSRAGIAWFNRPLAVVTRNAIRGTCGRDAGGWGRMGYEQTCSHIGAYCLSPSCSRLKCLPREDEWGRGIAERLLGGRLRLICRSGKRTLCRPRKSELDRSEIAQIDVSILVNIANRTSGPRRFNYWTGEAAVPRSVISQVEVTVGIRVAG